MVALLQMPCRSGCPSAVRGSFCALTAIAMHAVRTSARIMRLLLLRRARARQDIRQRVISFVTRVFIHPVRRLVQGDPRRPRLGERRWIVDGEFVLNHIR